ncbi:MAG: hypothetical protein JWN87_1711 [Frankiales bacterium]|jgi:hypothetical protein|nr:hypothetical protein [Frankiales bacterium]
MVGVLAPTALHPAPEVHDTFEAVRAEALFASSLQPSESPSPDQVRRTVSETLRQLGTRGCAAQVAGAYGDHPNTAVVRMTWALASIRAVYPLPAPAATTHLTPLLALAS